jgi:penicillin-binding protein 2
MRISNHYQEQRQFLSRAVIAAGIVFIALCVIAGRLYQLQVIEHSHFKTLSQDNRLKLEPIPPVRGLIYDRKGRLLANNRPAYNLEIIPEQVPNLDQTIDQLSQLITLSERDIDRFHSLRKRSRRFESLPIRVNLSDEDAAKFSVESHRFPGVGVRAHLLREYPYSDISAHVLGYVGRVSLMDLEKLDEANYSGTSHVGKIGLERSYEDTLHGTVGNQQVEVNSVGRIARVVNQAAPVNGQDIHLYLDIDLQKIAMESLGEFNGAVIAMDVVDGGILAMASNPSFDPNLFVEGISTKDYSALQQDENRPLYDRALKGVYPPGSTVKPFVGLAGLETGSIHYHDNIYCPGHFKLPNHSHKYRDWKKTGHGAMDLKGAITQSCDVYYYKLASDMGVDSLSKYLEQFGFGEKTGIDLIGEASGILPSRSWKRAVRNQPWYAGETVIMGIGQGYFLTSPLQLATATAAFANNGDRLTPRLVKYISDTKQASAQAVDTDHHPVSITNKRNWTEVHDAMVNVTEGKRGTAKRIRTPLYRIAGKTGTAQVFTVKQDEEYDEEKIAKKFRDHALFVAYAPADAPQIAVAVIVENGGHGGSTAAPIARKLMDAYLLPKLGMSLNQSTEIPAGFILGEE